tara:strand:+ start:48 stop:455 length:408 start_codon:yes stop_codon:yes gene_type:complete
MKNFFIISVLSIILTSCIGYNQGEVYRMQSRISDLSYGMSKRSVGMLFSGDPIYQRKNNKEVFMYCDVFRGKKGSFFEEYGSALAQKSYTWIQIWFKDGKLVGYDTFKKSGVNFLFINDDCGDNPPEPNWSLFPE